MDAVPLMQAIGGVLLLAAGGYFLWAARHIE